MQKNNGTTARLWPIHVSPNSSNLPVCVCKHTLAGFLGGSAHGVVATLWDSICITTQQGFPTMKSCRWRLTTLVDYLNPALAVTRQRLPGMVAHHGLSHAVRFGSYELSKRLIFSSLPSASKNTLHDVISDNGEGVNNGNQEHMVQVDYLAFTFLAGGLAGQAQHIASHFAEAIFLSHLNSASLPWRPLLFPLVMSFFPKRYSICCI